MGKNLVIVESPAKAKTIEKYLGKDFVVMASYGHVRDLPARKGSVKPEDDFAMTYALIERNARHVDAIAKALKQADALYLATDPDREGEAISWHVLSLMQDKGLLKDKAVHRVVFYEITKKAVKEAIENPRDIAMHLVNAQQARRALDYLVGFNLSPLLWKKVRRGLSAGRVQSPALRLIVEREEEIEQFVSKPYWYILAHCQENKAKFTGKLSVWQDQKLDQFYWPDANAAIRAKDEILARAKAELLVVQVQKKERLRHPAPPFITASLQQEAARKLGFTARKTMQIAQQLYEGIDIGSGGVSGLITYMRTDSVNLSQEALNSIRDLIVKRYGQDYCPDSPRYFKTKSKNAQEAHEAIRPTDVFKSPEDMKAYLSPDQRKLYQLIWQRSMASQMSSARLDTVAVDLQSAADDKFRANGSQIAFPGFLSVYEEGRDDKSDDDAETILPELKEGQKVKLLDIEVEEHSTEPPPRYSEASLVKALEEYEIGRPSTYANIIHTLGQREYVVLDKKRFIPTDVGRIVSHFLTDYFPSYVDYKFTAGLEDTLDAVARGEQEWVPILREFWQAFHERVLSVDESVKRKDVTSEELKEDCPKCAKPLAIRLGKRGRFIGCTAYPECDYTQALANSQSPEPEVQPLDRACPSCQAPLQIKRGKYGLFVGCSKYPECNFIEPLEKPQETDVTCPICHEHPILKRKSRKGRIFYSCGGYPKCKYAIWNEPVNKTCPKCQWPILSLKVTKKFGQQLLCPQTECDYLENLDSEA